MEMDHALLMRLYDIFRKQNSLGQILADLPCHIITLCRVDHRVFIRILLVHFLIHMLDQRKNSIICCIRLTSKFSLITVTHILLCYFVSTHSHNAGLHHILDILHMYCVTHLTNLLCNIVCNGTNLILVHLVNIVNLSIRFINRILDLGKIKIHLFSITFDDLCLNLNIHDTLLLPFESFMLYLM